MIDNFDELIIPRQYNYIQSLVNRVNSRIKQNNFQIAAVIFHKYCDEYSILMDFGDNLKGYLLFSKSLEELYKHLCKWETMDYWDLLIQIVSNIDLSKKALKL